MEPTVNAAAVKAAATITRRIAGRGDVTVTTAGRMLRFTRNGELPGSGRSTLDVAVTASTVIDDLAAPMTGSGILTDDDVRRIATAKGSVTVQDVGGGIRFAVDGVNLATTRDGERVREADADRYLGSADAVHVMPDAYAAAEAVGTLQGVAEAAASGSDSRAVLTAVALNADGSMAATDTYRLHVAERRYVTGDVHLADGLMPAHVLRAIPSGKVGMFALSVQPHGRADGRWSMRVHLRYGTRRNPCTLVVEADGQTVEGPYPRWRNLMPDAASDSQWMPVVGTYALPDAMTETVKRVQPKGPTLIRWSDDGAVDFVALADDPVSVNMHAADDAPCATVGTATTGSGEVVMNSTYLRDAADFVGAGSTFELRDPIKPVHLVGTDREALVMPMRGWSA